MQATKEQIFCLHNSELVWTLDKKNKRKENLLTTLVISAWQEHIHWLYPSVTFFVSKFWRSCEKSYGNSVNTLWSALKALTRKSALSSNCFLRVDWLVSKVWWRRGTGCAVCRISEILNWNCFWKFQIQGLQTSDHRFSPVQFQLEELHVNWTEPERIMNQMHNCLQCTSHPKCLLILIW